MELKTIKDVYYSLMEDAEGIEDEDIKINVMVAADTMLRLYETERAKTMRRIDGLVQLIERLRFVRHKA